MAINKKLIHFNSKENFDSKVANNEILDTSIVFIKDSKEIYTHGNLYKSVNWSVLKPAAAVALAGDIAYWDGSKVKTVSQEKWDTSLGTPVGVVVVPTGFAPDGKARMVALSGQTITTWGGYGTDISGMTNYDMVPTTDNAGSTSTGSNSYGYLPSDNFTGATSYVDSVAKYSQTSDLIPSPYAGDAPNPDYYKTISGYNNALSDFSGKANTELLVGLETDYPAANACWTYSDGISNTQWYLPACGELGYMMLRFNEINAGLAKVNAVQLDSSSYYWSSSEYSSDNAYDVNADNGYVYYFNKDYRDCARPWATITTNEVIMNTFTVADVSYDYEMGMTWRQWQNSKYNTVNLSCSGEGEYGIVTWNSRNLRYCNSTVSPDDLIMPVNYETNNVAGGGSN